MVSQGTFLRVHNEWQSMTIAYSQDDFWYVRSTLLEHKVCLFNYSVFSQIIICVECIVSHNITIEWSTAIHTQVASDFQVKIYISINNEKMNIRISTIEHIFTGNWIQVHPPRCTFHMRKKNQKSHSKSTNGVPNNRNIITKKKHTVGIEKKWINSEWENDICVHISYIYMIIHTESCTKYTKSSSSFVLLFTYCDVKLIKKKKKKEKCSWWSPCDANFPYMQANGSYFMVHSYVYTIHALGTTTVATVIK